MTPSRTTGAAGSGPAFGGRLPPRVRLVASSGGLGALLGMAGLVAVLAATGDLAFASEQVFSLGALVHGFAVTGWAGTVLFGPTVERLRRHDIVPVASDWTETSSRRAMASLAAVGGGAMVGVTATTLVLSFGFGFELA